MRRKKHGNYTYKQERARIFKDDRHDTYQSLKKYSDPTICIVCGSTYQNGRWTWEKAPDHSNETVCPACRKIEDGYFNGIIELSGDFFEKNKNEILNLIQNIEATERGLHPMERIAEINQNKNEVKTTGLHLARRIGDALKDAYKGDLEYTYAAENYIRVKWQR